MSEYKVVLKARVSASISLFPVEATEIVVINAESGDVAMGIALEKAETARASKGLSSNEVSITVEDIVRL